MVKKILNTHKKYRKISIIILFIFVLCVCMITSVISTYKTYDEYARFYKLNKNKIQFSSSHIVARDIKYSDNSNVLISPVKHVDNSSYVLLADKISSYNHDVYISSYLFNSLDILSGKSYNSIYNSFTTKHKDFYLVVHGDLNDSGVKFVLEHISDVKGIVFLDGCSEELIDANIKTLCIYSDDYILDKSRYPSNTEYFYIKGGSFDGYANYINKDLNELSWERQQRIVVDKIVEFMNEG